MPNPHLPFRTLAAVAFTIASLSSVAIGQSAEGRVHGVVADESGGVLPGVTVAATAPDGTVVAADVTNNVGLYALALPAAPVALTFSLEGFSPATVDVDVAAGEDVRVAAQRLAVAPRSETVVVHGDPKVDIVSAPARPSLPPPPPPPAVNPVPEHDHDSICAPAKADASPESLGTVFSQSSNYEHEHDNSLFATNDQIIVDGGTQNGLTVGQNVVARRSYRPTPDMRTAIGEHTAGVLQIVSATEQSSVAVVIYACDEIMRGDRLAAFAPEPVRAPEPAGTPAFDDAAQILFADAGQLLGAPRRFMVIDRGADQAIHAGQRLTLFRRGTRGEHTPTVVGDAVVVAVRHDSATIRVERVNDAVAFGDLAAPQRAAESARPQ
jgi:Carboxypeptidase regulatory-like domain